MLNLKTSRIITIYAVVSALWIVFSDNVAAFFFSQSPTALLWVGTLKGWFYVAIISGLLWAMLKRVEVQSVRQNLALQESEARYRSVIENIPDVYYRTDTSDRIIMASPSALKLLNYMSLDELLGRSSASFWEHPEQRAAFKALLEHSGEVRDYEVTLLRSDSIPVIVSTSSRYYYDSTGSIAGVEGLFRDITARKQSEMALKDSEERLRRAELAAGTGNWEIDLATNRVHVSEGARHIYGLYEEVLTLADIQTVPLPEYRPMLDEALRRLVDEGASYAVDFKIRRVNDETNRDIYSMATYDEDREMVFGIIQDITDRKKTEDALKESEERYALALRGTNDGIWDWNVRTGQVYFSPRWKEIIGYAPDELVNDLEEWTRRVHPEDLERVRKENEKCSRGQASSFEVEYRLLHKDGSYRWILGRGASLKNDRGEVVRMAGAHTDITERRNMMEAMLQTEKMMSVGGLAAGMAHEINNPLSGILQNVQVLERRLAEDSPVNNEAARAAGCSFQAITEFMKNRAILSGLESVREAGVRAAQVVTSMLEFSRRSESKKAPANLNELLDKAVGLCATDYDLKKKYDFREIRIVREYSTSLPAVQCSRNQIQQVFMNLLTNAAHALRGSPSPGIVLRTACEGNVVRVEIEDNGPGMDEATRRKVFEPFFTTKPVGEGTGLGLSVSYFIITNNHGGTIEVESEPGKGARFIITLPAGQ